MGVGTGCALIVSSMFGEMSSGGEVSAGCERCLSIIHFSSISENGAPGLSTSISRSAAYSDSWSEGSSSQEPQVRRDVASSSMAGGRTALSERISSCPIVLYQVL